MKRLLAPTRVLLRERAFVVVLGCCLLLGLSGSFVSPFLSMFGTLEVKMGPLQFGVFMTITSSSAIVVSTVLARWSDTHLSRRNLLLLGSVGGVLGYIGYALVRDPLWLTIIGSTVLALSAVTFSQVFAYARELLGQANVPANEAPLYMNFFRMSIALAWTVGPALASWVMVLSSYRGMFLVAALLYLAFMAVVARWIPDAPPPGAQAAAARTPLRDSLRRPDLLAYFAGFVVISACTTVGMMNLPLLVLQTLQGTPHDVGIIYSVAPVFELPLMFYFGLLASTGDQTRLIRRGAIIAIAYYALLALVRMPWQVYPVQILGAAMTAINSGVAITFFQNYLPGQPGTATNLYANALRIGSTAGYLLFGALAAGLGYRGVFVVCAVLSAGTLLLFLAQRRRAQLQGQALVSPAEAA
jgi:SET family sugar efflux transporter-like MFS transporter